MGTDYRTSLQRDRDSRAELREARAAMARAKLAAEASRAGTPKQLAFMRQQRDNILGMMPSVLDRLYKVAMGEYEEEWVDADGVTQKRKMPPNVAALQYLIAQGIGPPRNMARDAFDVARAQLVEGQVAAGLPAASVRQMEASTEEREAYIATYRMSIVDEDVVARRERVMVSRFLSFISKTLSNEIPDEDRRQLLLESAGAMLQEAHSEATEIAGTPFDATTMDAEVVDHGGGGYGSYDEEITIGTDDELC